MTRGWCRGLEGIKARDDWRRGKCCAGQGDAAEETRRNVEYQLCSVDAESTDLQTAWPPMALCGDVPGAREAVCVPALRQAPCRAQCCALELKRIAVPETALSNCLLGGVLSFRTVWCRTEYIWSKVMPSNAPTQRLLNRSTMLARHTSTTTTVQPIPNMCLRVRDAAFLGCRRIRHQLGKSRLAFSELNCFFKCAAHIGNDGTTVVRHKSTVVVCPVTTSVVKPCHDR